jgi:hypothetical protein
VDANVIMWVRGKIVAIDLLVDPERLTRLDLVMPER